MSRKALIASLVGALALGLGAISAQAAPVSMSESGVRAGTASLVQTANWRRNQWWFWRHHRHHRRHHWR